MGLLISGLGYFRIQSRRRRNATVGLVFVCTRESVRLIPRKGGHHHRDCDRMKRIPRIKFPKRHQQPTPPDAKSTSQVTSAPSSQMTAGTSEVPAPPRNMEVGGKASVQPKRTPVSDREIEAILLGGCF